MQLAIELFILHIQSNFRFYPAGKLRLRYAQNDNKEPMYYASMPSVRQQLSLYRLA
ncbi:hypothetical protein CAL7102_01837 [Dulcicalothrix desertica PCC 7102]|nr:hypothetical protein CAL7102_01837 [Dulcicalothrix desertica PCC 7102]